ncbi:MAG TPA: DUF5018 domain-containing protein [archaeon]|nr:DUF5018 domain-containing protein [archaeon]
MNIKKKALSPIVATILLVVVSVILVSIILSFGKSFTNQGLDKTKDIKELSQSDAEHFVYPKTFSEGVVQFNYSPPNNSFGEVQITKYKILYDNNETEEIELTTPYTLSTGTNLLNLEDFSDQNIPTKKFALVLETEENEYITLKNITNPEPYVEELSTEKLITSFIISEISGTINNDNNTISLSVPYGTNVTALTPTIIISDETTISPESGIAQDFTNPVIYTVTAEDQSTRVYTVTIIVEELGLLYLYNEGTGEDDWQDMSGGSSTNTKETDHLKIYGSDMAWGGFVTVNKIDLTDYNTLNIDWEGTITLFPAVGNYFGLGNAQDTTIEMGEGYDYNQMSSQFSRQISVLDISNNNGEFYIKVLQAWYDFGGTATTKIYKIWLE